MILNLVCMGKECVAKRFLRLLWPAKLKYKKLFQHVTVYSANIVSGRVLIWLFTDTRFSSLANLTCKYWKRLEIGWRTWGVLESPIPCSYLCSLNPWVSACQRSVKCRFEKKPFPSGNYHSSLADLKHSVVTLCSDQLACWNMQIISLKYCRADWRQSLHAALMYLCGEVRG